MAHQGLLNDLKHKNSHLEKLTANLTAQNQQLTSERDSIRNAL